MFGTSEFPIPRDSLKNYFDLLQQDPNKYTKVVPTLVLYPDSNSPDFSNDIPTFCKTVLKTKAGQSFEESVAKCNGKAILFNFCTDSLEIYPKSLEECAKIYDMDSLEKNTLPDCDNNENIILGLLQSAISIGCPIKPFPVDFPNIIEVMTYYKKLFRRDVPWRIAYNVPSSTVKILKLDFNIINNFLITNQNFNFKSGSSIFFEETFTPAYSFKEDDYVVMDLDKDGNAKLDKYGKTYVRIINSNAFEMTYNKALL